MAVRQPITIVGLGQAGAMLAYRLLEKGHSVRAIDARTIDAKGDKQTPWGWSRRVSLQSEAKRRLMSDEFPIPGPEIQEFINATHGPLLITSQGDATFTAWKKWIDQNPDSDSHVLTPTEASKQFDFNEEYFASSKGQPGGGVYVCDTRDHLIDFGKLNQHIWKHLKDHPNCELLDNTRIKKIFKTPTGTLSAQGLTTQSGDYIPIDKAIFTVGNQAAKILDNVPIAQLTIPYVMVRPNSMKLTQQKFASVWNKDSSLLLYKDGSIKLSCGVQGKFDYWGTNWSTSPHFLALAARGMSNVHWRTSNEQLMLNAKKELSMMGIKEEVDFDSAQIEYCNVDMTPSICPYIHFSHSANNILSICGFSGSGSMVLDTQFIDLVLDSVHEGVMHPRLTGFEPPTSLKSSWYPPYDKQTPVSAVG